MTKHISLFLGLALSLLIATTAALAAESSNGVRFNGIYLNGVNLNGRSPDRAQSTALSSLARGALSVQASDGARDVLNDQKAITKAGARRQ